MEKIEIEVVIFIGGLLLGILMTNLLSYFLRKMREKDKINDISSQFKQILTNLSIGSTKFKSRVNSTVYIETKLNDYGEVGLVYLMDKQDVAIFKNEKCIFTTDLIDDSLIDQITKEIETKHSKDINDIVEVLGFVFSREEFEKTFSINMDDVRMNNLPKKELSDIEKIVKKNKNKFDIDEILDKISKVGLGNLTEDEKKFLKNYNK
jgi:hypothetical protein